MGLQLRSSIIKNSEFARFLNIEGGSSQRKEAGYGVKISTKNILVFSEGCT
jgi:hypothetical protein